MHVCKKGELQTFLRVKKFERGIFSLREIYFIDLSRMLDIKRVFICILCDNAYYCTNILHV